MKKRTFIKLCTAAAAMPFEINSFAAPEKLSNWAGNIEYSTDNVATENSVAGVQDFVHKHSSFKTLGTRHCFNRIADSTQQLLTTDFAAQAPVIDSAARTISVGPGIRYGTIAPTLEKSGFALHNLASLPHISVAGAITTGTHGSGVKNGNLSTVVTALEIVNAAGDIVALSRKANPDIFPAAVVCLAALGVITNGTLNIQPTYQIPQTGYENHSFNARKAPLDAILAVEKLHDQIGPHLMITVIRTIAADDLWMSPAYKQDSVAIHFTWKPEWPEVSKLLPTIERELAPYNPRPHWGKLFTMAPAQL